MISKEKPLPGNPVDGDPEISRPLAVAKRIVPSHADKPESLPAENPLTAEAFGQSGETNIGTIDSQNRLIIPTAATQSKEGKAEDQKLPTLKYKPPSMLQVKAGTITRQMVNGVDQLGSSFQLFLKKILPGMTDEPRKLSRNSLIAIAVCVPLLIALIAGAVYVKTGKSKQFDQNLALAQQYAMQADVQKNDPPMYLASLQQSIFWLDKAESYGQSEDSAALRVIVQGELDILEGIQRLEMAEVIPGGLPAGSNITQIVATATDLYLLDEESGTIKRYFLNGSSYQADEIFDCGPNPDNLLNTLGKIVDMIPVNINNSFKATLLAIDASGNTEFCIPGDVGVIGSLTPPDQGWKQLKSISIFNSYLYVLDSGGNAVYRYEGSGSPI